ncbi:hypothetical protein THAPSDRAFT_22570 [Thalassiosira pseudonana CCMP1335]|uniref:HSF-type DNA-binding domain-containing protein n=1 Tax=Thalassiosira pseudonana TaxID=35128 RepID=B8C1V9_THAPS|nr:hypothetical protein THAPSDRAFT_22570 [Thalassiosira pseudonana CCMP1335]EED91834.1 hypothetical protein THAPSDRAFT_22570 [Thalassiosira pseudonana CCMP1335]
MDSNEADVETKPSAAAAGVEEKTAAAAAPPSGKSKQKGAPNSLPRAKPKPEEASVSTYVYRDFANVRDPVQLGEMLGSELVHEQVPPKKLQNQKLPAKLNAMLSDPEISSFITWMPHGRSFSVVDRENFAKYALPRYFGHDNFPSFVRIVNAWGFRRIVSGKDRDSYYHELFLRGRPDLHERMKRVPSAHRKTPVSKGDKVPDFYELAKVSPLQEATFNPQGMSQMGGMRGGMQGLGMMNPGMLGGLGLSNFGPYGGGGGVGGGLGNVGGGIGNLAPSQLSLMESLAQQQLQQQQQQQHSNQSQARSLQMNLQDRALLQQMLQMQQMQQMQGSVPPAGMMSNLNAFQFNGSQGGGGANNMFGNAPNMSMGAASSNEQQQSQEQSNLLSGLQNNADNNSSSNDAALKELALLRGWKG